ncbi:MAG: dTMP kinase [Candidatus Marinimicrobia bacterium]|nr:dTMP kinase [Candidatus Neomarinimicrobiota bacterium]|tara:strand:- start:39824 stop:40444 length:621 start_codon:yes stop_codon:yes gene_type:complete
MNKFITFEGIDGCGKTTQINLLSKYLDSKKQDNVIVREPGGTKISEKIRAILLDKGNDINSYTETLLFLSSRSQLVNEIIKKNIEQNKFVLCDRFTDSTLAYQGYGRGLNIQLLNDLNNFATQNISPDLTFVLDINLSESNKRINKRNIDRMEQSGKEFLNKVKIGYQKISNIDKDRYIFIDCCGKDIDSIHFSIVKSINERYKIN